MTWNKSSAVQVGALAFHGRIELVSYGIKDDADLSLSVHVECDWQTAVRKFVHKIGRAIDWIHDPDRFGGEVHLSAWGLFTDKSFLC